MTRTVEHQGKGTGGKLTKRQKIITSQDILQNTNSISSDIDNSANVVNTNQESAENHNNDNIIMCELTCKVCGTCPASFQCPLCQAEGLGSTGFYCSQTCFAKDWSAHRSSAHPSGRVKEKKRSENERKLQNSNDESKDVDKEMLETNDMHRDEKQNVNNIERNVKKSNVTNHKDKTESVTEDGDNNINSNNNDKNKLRCEDNNHARNAVKRPRNDASATKVEGNIFAKDNTNSEINKEKITNTYTLPIWTPIPSAHTCAQLHYAQITPPLPLECKRAIILFNEANFVESKSSKKSENNEKVILEEEESVESSKNNQHVVSHQEGDSFNTQELIRHAMWPAITAMAHYLASYVKHTKEVIYNGSEIIHEHIVIVTGDASSAFAMAWALRCAKIFESISSLPVASSFNKELSANSVNVKLNMRLDTESDECCHDNHNNNSDNTSSTIQITIISQEVVCKYSVDGSVSFLFTSAHGNCHNNSNNKSNDNNNIKSNVFECDTSAKGSERESDIVKKMLITLPNVHNAMDLQGVDMSAIFVFAGCKKNKQNKQLCEVQTTKCNGEMDDYVNCLFDNSTCEINSNIAIDENEADVIDTDSNNSGGTTASNSKNKTSKVKKNKEKKKKSVCENNKLNTVFVYTLTDINSTNANMSVKKLANAKTKKKQYNQNELLEEDSSCANENTTRMITSLPITWCDLPLRVTKIKQKEDSVAKKADTKLNHVHLEKDNGDICTKVSDNNNNNNNNNNAEIITTENNGVRHRETCITRFHDNIATSIASGDLNLFLEQLAALFEQAPGKVEEILYNTLCCDRPALHVTHAHHRLAYILRHCARVSFTRASTYASRVTRFEEDNYNTTSGNNHNSNTQNYLQHYVTTPNSSNNSNNAHGSMDHSLFGIALRVIVKLCKLLPPLENNRSSNSSISTKDKFVNTENRSCECNEQLQSLSEPSAAELQRYYNYYNPHHVNNLQLQATLAFIYPLTSAHVLDSLAAAWDVHMVIPSIRNALANSPERRKQAAERIRLRYGSKFDNAYVHYLIALMLILYDTVAIFGMGVSELETRLQWTLSGMRTDVGELKQFLNDCMLLQEDKQTRTQYNNTSGKIDTLPEITSLSSRLTSLKTRQPSRSELTRQWYQVRLLSVSEYKPLPYQVLPIAQYKLERRRQQELSAMEEILMVMPVDPRPVYIGEVGNRLGKWIHFNAKYNGQLGVSLSEFMMRHPEHFKVVGTLVTRITRASNTVPIKVRYDNDENVDYLNRNGNHSDVDEDEGDTVNARTAKKLKISDRALLTGQGNHGNRSKQKNKSAEEMLSKLPSRTRRKRAKKAANAARFNKNYKPFDKSAHVPGYVKHGPRKIKGRGKKPNKRLHKRS